MGREAWGRERNGESEGGNGRERIRYGEGEEKGE